MFTQGRRTPSEFSVGRRQADGQVDQRLTTVCDTRLHRPRTRTGGRVPKAVAVRQSHSQIHRSRDHFPNAISITVNCRQ